MHINKVPGLLVLLCCKFSVTIKVPTAWDDTGDSAVKNEPKDQVEGIKPQNVRTLHQSQQIPVEYFQYTAQKPQFAADIAAFHGVKNPQQHYKAYPLQPYTGRDKPVLGVHQFLNEDKTIFQPYQKYVQNTEEIRNHVHPTSTGYEVFHPYKNEEPALKEIYNDPVLSKIRGDLQQSKLRLQEYEEDAGQANIASDEYLEDNKKTDEKLFPHKNKPARYEIHRPQRRPIYYNYRPPNNNHIQKLNYRFRHPWNQQSAKIRPAHYKPLHNHIHNLRQNHALKYDDERNEYPQAIFAENLEEPQEGYDIYEKGKQKYQQLRNNADESLNKAVLQNRPLHYQKLELQKVEPQSQEEVTEFVPVKNYAQVRKTETFKHVPKKAAFDDAETFEEILNAPRLREAVKSTKAQTVYSEEGYEDSAYDHAGEQKHASDHEGHGGFLKENENSKGLYKIPSVLGSYQDGSGTEYRDKLEHGKKWKNSKKDDKEQIDEEDYSEEDNDEYVSADAHIDKDPEIANHHKREIRTHPDTKNNFEKLGDTQNTSALNVNETKVILREEINNQEHELGKREATFKVPEINLNSTYLTEEEILNIAKSKILPQTSSKNSIEEKYPYYFKNLKAINKNSPLRYAENLKLMPKKSKGGTEFYDSRSVFECPEVDDDVDPLPEKLKNGEDPTEEDDDDSNEETKGEKKFETDGKQQRLKGLGDKIDCFKAKYFGENPLDSPFFTEDIIPNPEPIIAPNLPIHKQMKLKKRKLAKDSKVNNITELLPTSSNNIFVLLDKLRINRSQALDTQSEPNNASQKSNPDILTKHSNQSLHLRPDMTLNLSNANSNVSNVKKNIFQNKEYITNLPPKFRKKRATPFVYEPYKIIRDSQVQDSKKTTTTSNISPLIRQLQTSKVVDRVSRSNNNDRHVRSNGSNRKYVNIDRNARANSNSNPTIIDVSIDHRRGEPRYEIRPTNHKAEYTPVEHKKSISLEDYKARSSAGTAKNLSPIPGSHAAQLRSYSSDPLLFSNLQSVAASNAIKTSVTTDNEANNEAKKHKENEYLTSTSTTTIAPSFRRRMKSTTTTTTQKPHPTNEDEPERLKLVTRFRNYKPNERPEIIEDITKEDVDDIVIPKYREKKKKSSKSTLVTDTKKYGEDGDAEDNLREEDIDAMIGVKQDMSDYMPSYEKDEDYIKSDTDSNGESDDSYNGEEDTDDSEDDDDESGEDDEEDEEENSGEETEDEDQTNEEEDLEVTTPEPPKRSLVKTTEAPSPTVASNIRNTDISRTGKPDVKPIVTKKKIEIHKELPVDKSAPHITQFKQDIKEVEILKEIPAMPKRRPNEKEVLQLYKDDNLAKDINKLGDVEIFRENLNLDTEPKHGGNYRKATREDLKRLKVQGQDSKNSPKDAEVSQSRYKHVELFDPEPSQMHGGNLKYNNKRPSGRRNEKLIELDEDRDDNSPRRDDNYKSSSHNSRQDKLHGGNYRSARLTEVMDKESGDQQTKLSEPRRKGNGDAKTKDVGRDTRMRAIRDKMIGAKPKQDDALKINLPMPKVDDIGVQNPAKEARKSATDLLNSYVRAAPALTTTPGYILDPSKRMYYYVDK